MTIEELVEQLNDIKKIYGNICVFFQHRDNVGSYFGESEVGTIEIVEDEYYEEPIFVRLNIKFSE